MKFKCNKTELLQVLNIVTKAVPSRSVNPLMECLLIEVHSNYAHITGNNNELMIEADLDAEVIERGNTAINAKMLNDIARKLSNDVVTITDSNNVLTISCGKAKFNIACLNDEEFLRVPEIKEEGNAFVTSVLLRDMVRQTLFSTSQNEASAVLCGELLEVHNGSLKLSCTDGHRVAIRQTENVRNANTEQKAIVPAATMQELVKILPGTSEDVEIIFSKNHLRFKIPGGIITTRLIEGKYPDLGKLFNPQINIKMSVDRRDFTDCVNRASILVKEGDKKPLVLKIDRDEVRASVNSAIGSVDEEIDCEMEYTDDIMIGFNPRFLLEALNAVDDDKITLEMIDRRSPCYIRDNEEESYMYIILPVNIG